MSDNADSPLDDTSSAQEQSLTGSTRSSEPERVRGLMATMNRKEAERRQALDERDEALQQMEDMRQRWLAAQDYNNEAAPSPAPADKAADSESVAPSNTDPLANNNSSIAPTGHVDANNPSKVMSSNAVPVSHEAQQRALVNEMEALLEQSLGDM